MSDREMVLNLINKIPDYKIGYVLAYIQGITADEDADDKFCRDMYADYLNSPDKGDFVPFEDVLNECGVRIDEL